MFKEGLKKQECEICGYTDNLELHHKNGDPTDNRIENLQILCPNCHAKTNNFRGKNIYLPIRNHTPADSLFLSDYEVTQRYLEKLEKKRIKQREKYRIEHPNVKSLEKKDPIFVICPICGNQFRQTAKRNKYCSKDCQKEAMLQQSKRPSFLELIKSLKQYNNFVATAKFYNVTDNTIRK